MIRVPSDGLSFGSDMIRVGPSIERFHGSLIRMGYHPDEVDTRYIVVVL